MLCRRCMTVMELGTTYEQKGRENKSTHKRFCQCPKCKDKFYINSPNFQEYLNTASKENK